MAELGITIITGDVDWGAIALAFAFFTSPEEPAVRSKVIRSQRNNVMVLDEETEEEEFTQNPSSGFWSLLVATLSAEFKADHSRKVSRRVLARKEIWQDQASA